MRDEPRHQLARRKLVVAVAVRSVPLTIGGHAIEMQIRIRREALRLLVVERGMRIAPREPAPRPVLVIRLTPVDDDVRNATPQRLHDAPPAPPLRVRTCAFECQEGVIERITGDAGAIVERHQLLDQPVLQRTITEARRLLARIAARRHEPLGVLRKGQHRIDVRQHAEPLSTSIVHHFTHTGRNGIRSRIPLVAPYLLSESKPEHVLPAPVVHALFAA